MDCESSLVCWGFCFRKNKKLLDCRKKACDNTCENADTEQEKEVKSGDGTRKTQGDH